MEYPERDDENFLKHTIATFDPSSDEPDISYKNVDARYFPVAKRDYKKKVTLKSLDLSRIPEDLPSYV
jgi:succinate dehydrogenase / fumarate reductase flavoprotein subunit